MANATTDFAILIKAQDLASKVFKKVGKTGSDAGKFIKDNWKAAAGTMTAAGTALEVMGQKAAVNNERIKALSITTGIQVEAMRELALETTNVTRPLSDVTALFQQANKQGIESSKGLKEYAAFWDTVGDATKENSVQLANAGAALRAVGIAAGEEAESMAALGFVHTQTAGKVGDFLNFIGRAGPELRELNFDVTDSAAIMGLLEDKFGLTAKTAKAEFVQAVNESNGNVKVFMQSLGITSRELDAYRGKVIESKDVINELADAHAESYTIIQILQQRLDELFFKYSGQIQIASQLAPILIGLAAAITAVAIAGPPVVAAVGSMTAAFSAFAAITVGPVAIAIAGVVAAIGVLYLVWKSNLGGIQDASRTFVSNLESRFTGLSGWLGDWGDWIKSNVWEPLVESFNWVIDKLKVAASFWGKTFEEETAKLPGIAKTELGKLADVIDDVLGDVDFKFDPVTPIGDGSGEEKTAADEELNRLKEIEEARKAGLLAMVESHRMSLLSRLDQLKEMKKKELELEDLTAEQIAIIRASWDKRIADEQKRLAAESKSSTEKTAKETESIWDRVSKSVEQSWTAGLTAIVSGQEAASGSVLGIMEATWETVKQMVIQNVIEMMVKNVLAALNTAIANIWASAAVLLGNPLTAPAGIAQATASIGLVSGILGGLTALAEGGIVTGPTAALVGEAGPEAVIPLSRMGPSGFGNNIMIVQQGQFLGSQLEARKFARSIEKQVVLEMKRRGDLK